MTTEAAEPSRSLVRRTIEATRPAFGADATLATRTRAGAAGAAAVAVTGGAIVGLSDLGTQLVAHNTSTVMPIAEYLGQTPAWVGGSTFVVAGAASVLMAAIAHDEHDREEPRALANFLRRTKVGGYMTAGSLGLLGGGLALSGGDAITATTGHVLVDLAATAGVVGLVSHAYSSMWNRILPKNAQQALGE